MLNPRIVWLASYPKSGNTWFRVFLANLLQDGDTPIDINELESSPIASNRKIFDEATGLSSSDLSPIEIENLRPSVYRFLSKGSKSTVFMKIHDAYTLTSTGEALVPEESTLSVLYFVRNPLDVAVSFSHHSGNSFEKTIENMGNDNYTLSTAENRLQNQLEQRLRTWSKHIQSWVDNPNLRVKIIRYEDMKTDTFDTFKSAVEFTGLQYSDSQIEKAIRFSSFDVLRKQEEEHGFREKAPDSQKFFRKGEIGSWKTELSAKQCEQIIAQHNAEMKRWGYL